MRRRIRVAAASSLLALGVLGLNACGGGDDDEGTVTEATVSPETTTEATVPPETTTVAKLSPEQVQELRRGKQVQELRRAATDWASLFATNNCNRYMGQPICERLQCLDIENCTRVSAAFQRSFADATVEDIKFKGVEVLRPSNRRLYLATVKFSNGEVVVFSGGGPEPPAGSCAGPGGGCVYNVASEPDQNRRFVQAAAPRD
jgi:hypothetical protein